MLSHKSELTSDERVIFLIPHLFLWNDEIFKLTCVKKVDMKNVNKEENVEDRINGLGVRVSIKHTVTEITSDFTFSKKRSSKFLAFLFFRTWLKPFSIII